MPEDEIKSQLEGMKKLIELSQKRTELSQKRSQMSAMRSYMNAERTLSVWVRTALASMIFGIAIERLGLMLYQMPDHIIRGHLSHPDIPSKVTGIVLVVFSMLMSLSSGIRFMAFARSYKKEFPLPAYHKTWLPAAYAFMVVFFGAALLVVMLWIR